MHSIKLGIIAISFLVGFFPVQNDWELQKFEQGIAYKAKDLREGYEGITCVYTGEMPRNRKWLL